MTTYEVHPGVGIGPFAIGLTLDEVLIAAERHGFELSDWPDPDIVPFDGWLMLRLDAYERVARMEAVIPSVRDEKALVLGDILLGLPVNVVVPALDRLGYRPPHRTGVAVSEYPELGLSLFLDTNARIQPRRASSTSP